MALEHQVKLIHAKFVRPFPFVQGNKTDAADTKAIWKAMLQPKMCKVADKTEDQQVILALHRMRLSLIKFRTIQVNQLRGLLYEFGIMLKGGRQAGLEEIMLGMLFDAIKEQLKRLDEIETDEQNIERRIKD